MTRETLQLGSTGNRYIFQSVVEMDKSHRDLKVGAVSQGNVRTKRYEALFTSIVDQSQFYEFHKLFLYFRYNISFIYPPLGGLGEIFPSKYEFAISLAARKQTSLTANEVSNSYFEICLKRRRKRQERVQHRSMQKFNKFTKVFRIFLVLQTCFIRLKYF